MIKDELNDRDLEVMAEKPEHARGEAESVIERTREELPEREAEAVIQAAEAESRDAAGRELWRDLAWFIAGGALVLLILADWRLAIGGVFVACLFALPYFLAASVTASRDEEKRLLARELQHHKHSHEGHPPEPHPQP